MYIIYIYFFGHADGLKVKRHVRRPVTGHVLGGSLEVCVALAAIHIHWLFEEPIVAEKKGFDFSSLG